MIYQFWKFKILRYLRFNIFCIRDEMGLARPKRGLGSKWKFYYFVSWIKKINKKLVIFQKQKYSISFFKCFKICWKLVWNEIELLLMGLDEKYPDLKAFAWWVKLWSWRSHGNCHGSYQSPFSVWGPLPELLGNWSYGLLP